MSSLQPVAAGFVIAATKDREREYLTFLVRRGEPGVPLEDAIFEIRNTDDGDRVVLLPFRSYEAARRVQKIFEKSCKDHQRAERQRSAFELLGD